MNLWKKLVFICLALFSASLMIAGSAGCNQKPANKTLVLFSDFGSADYRVAQFKGIINNANSSAVMIDGSEDVPAFDVPTGAYILNVAAREFPANTVFVAVIDTYSQPEVRYIVLTTDKGQIFVLPDNGLLTYVLRNYGTRSLYQITNQKLFDQPIAQLAAERIEGKVAALIAGGYAPKDVGTALSEPRTLNVQEPAISGGKLQGSVVYIDNFGNGVTNISGKTAATYGLTPGDTIQVVIGESNIAMKFGTIYSDVPKGQPVAFISGNLGVLQLSINLGSFASNYKLKAGTNVEIQK